jgi:hypothetical protein
LAAAPGVKDMDFPKLLYIGDVPVESTTGGAALLYRLLMTWPVDRLRIVETNLLPCVPSQRLPGVEYRKIPIRFRRLLSTRFGYWWSGHLFRAAKRGKYANVAVIEAAEFKPDAILTVTQSYAWLTASYVAKRLGVPLHLIVHDDVALLARASAGVTRQIIETFGQIYLSATSRLCVSPHMAEAYQKQFGAPGDVLYPSRAAGMNGFDEPPARLAETNRPLTYAYAGSLWAQSYTHSLVTLSEIARRRGDRLLIFSNLDPKAAPSHGLAGPHVELHPIIPFRQLIDILRSRVDVLFVPMSFDPNDRATTEVAFPSKLTDYTAVGLPLLIQGPEYSSAIRWARANPGVAVAVEQDSSAALEAATAELADPGRRLDLGRNAIRAGREYFSHEAVFAKFVSKVCWGSTGV